MSALVLGVGNVLLMDESIGIRAVEELERRYSFSEDVEILDGGTSGIELLRYLAGRDLLIIVDAVRSKNPPGTVVRVEGDDVPKRFMTRISPHQLGVSDLLAAARLTEELPGNMVLFGIEPASMEMELGLSDEVKKSFDRLIEVIADELRANGYSVDPNADYNPAAPAASAWDRLSEVL